VTKQRCGGGGRDQRWHCVREAVGGDLLRDNDNRSGSATTGRAAASKRRRVIGTSSDSTLKLCPSSSTSQHHLRYHCFSTSISP
jgi:hypothetical protein